MMLGGVMGGNCATGNVSTATTPASVMTMDSTDAKIGRSIKKCENMSPRDYGAEGACLRSGGGAILGGAGGGVSGRAGGAAIGPSADFALALASDSYQSRTSGTSGGVGGTS